MKLDVSIGVSLVDREKEAQLKDSLQNIHPSIPGAKMPKEDRKELNVQKFRVQNRDLGTEIPLEIEDDP